LLSGKLVMFVVPLLVARAAAAANAACEGADDDSIDGCEATSDTPEGTPPPPPPLPTFPSRSARYYPPPVDGPALRLPETPTRLYVDGSYAIVDDLTALPYIAGRAGNFRAALGASWRWRRFTFEGQLPVNFTWIDVSSVLNMPPQMQDQKQTALSLGDLTLGAIWTGRLTDGEGLIAGFALRGRLATHTTRFDFHLADGTLAAFVVPYYFHIEPTVVVGGALGPLRYVMNQGAIALVGPDGNFDEQHITVPSIYFWDAHYAISLAPWSFLGASVELATMIQLNRVAPIEGQDVTKFNDIRAVWIAPALQAHAGAYRFDAIARFGLSRSQAVTGVLEYVGTHSFTLRATRYFD